MRHVVLVPLLLLLGCGESPSPESTEFQVSEALSGGDAADFARAGEIRPFSFPEDHGPHPDFRNEWWYLTGNLQADDGRRFGFQITFFRIALSADPLPSPSAWRTPQIWMGHAALSDLSERRHRAHERFARQAIGLAGASATPFRVWLEDWQLSEVEDSTAWRLRVPTDDFELALELVPVSPVILQGERGLSQKSAEPGNASYYYSIPRLRARGRITRGREKVTVSGLAWLDREWSTSALGPEQAGWDWFSLQLEDGRNLMYYQLRRKDGSTDPHSAGTLSDSAGLQRRLDPAEIQLTPLRYWTADGRRYPVEWRLQLQHEPHPWHVRALMADQEMRLSVRYWEGAVEVLDTSSGERLGRGYLEMTGYADEDSG